MIIEPLNLQVLLCDQLISLLHFNLVLYLYLVELFFELCLHLLGLFLLSDGVLLLGLDCLHELLFKQVLLVYHFLVEVHDVLVLVFELSFVLVLGYLGVHQVLLELLFHVRELLALLLVLGVFVDQLLLQLLDLVLVLLRLCLH